MNQAHAAQVAEIEEFFNVWFSHQEPLVRWFNRKAPKTLTATQIYQFTAPDIDARTAMRNASSIVGLQIQERAEQHTRYKDMLLIWPTLSEKGRATELLSFVEEIRRWPSADLE